MQETKTNGKREEKRKRVTEIKEIKNKEIECMFSNNRKEPLERRKLCVSERKRERRGQTSERRKAEENESTKRMRERERDKGGPQ